MNSDPINPKHYKHLPAEAIDIIEAATAKAPSNKAAYLQGQVLKYLLRCWSKKGIEDLRKAKWYLDRLVASFDDLLAKASGANETPSDDTEIPQGWRELKSDEVPSVGDKFPFGDAQYTLFSNWTVTYGCGRSDHVYIRKIETQIDEPKEQAQKPEDFIAEFFDAVSKTLGPAPTKRYRQPTLEDLKNGPIECEVGDKHEKRTLIYVFPHGQGRARFATVDKEMVGCVGRWIDCRIEVAE